MAEISLDKLDHGNLGKRFRREWDKVIQNMFDFPDTAKRKIKITITVEAIDLNEGKIVVHADCAGEMVRPAPLRTNMGIQRDRFGNRTYTNGWTDAMEGQMSIEDYVEALADKIVDPLTGEILEDLT